MTRTGVSLICIAAGLATAAAAEAPSRAALRHLSWGKAGVTLEDYRADASACAHEAANLDIANTSAAKSLVAASRAIDTAYSNAWMYWPARGGGLIAGSIGHDIQQVMHAYRVDQQFADISDLQYRTLDTCLTARGYRRFRLSADQEAQLGHLRRGSEARRAYLHSLGSDPQILSRQAL